MSGLDQKEDRRRDKAAQAIAVETIFSVEEVRQILDEVCGNEVVTRAVCHHASAQNVSPWSVVRLLRVTDIEA